MENTLQIDKSSTERLIDCLESKTYTKNGLLPGISLDQFYDPSIFSRNSRSRGDNYFIKRKDVFITELIIFEDCQRDTGYFPEIPGEVIRKGIIIVNQGNIHKELLACKMARF